VAAIHGARSLATAGEELDRAASTLDRAILEGTEHGHSDRKGVPAETVMLLGEAKIRSAVPGESRGGDRTAVLTESVGVPGDGEG
jgi:hypothetical protein